MLICKGCSQNLLSIDGNWVCPACRRDHGPDKRLTLNKSVAVVRPAPIVGAVGVPNSKARTNAKIHKGTLAKCESCRRQQASTNTEILC